MQAAEMGDELYPPLSLDCSTERRIFGKREMCTGPVVVARISAEHTPQHRAEPKMIVWSKHSRRIDLTGRSTYPFCQGDRGAVGRSLIPIALTRRLNASP
jgi:hypothetical protein